MTSMSNSGEDSGIRADDRSRIYMIPVDLPSPQRSPGLDSWQLLQLTWRKRWFVLGVTFLFTCVAMSYALLATQWYRSETTLKPTDLRAGITSQLGGFAGLATLAGIDLGVDGDAAEAIAVLRSREFQRDFISDLAIGDLLHEQAGRWPGFRRHSGANIDGEPDLRQAMRFFNLSILRVVQDKKTGLVVLGVDWTDPVLAAEWANLLVERVNERTRLRAATRAEANIRFLSEELAGTTMVPLQQSIASVLEREYETLMLARGNRDFAFQVIDPAAPPDLRVRPKRTVIVALAAMLGFAVACAIVFVRAVIFQRAQRDR